MPFCWLKLGLGAANFLISVVLFAILIGIGALIGTGAVGVMLFVWLILSQVISYFLKHYIGYMAKAGHVAVIATAVTTGQVPENVIKTGKDMVLERFATANVYFVVDKLVSGAVKQLQGLLDRVGNLFSAVPGISTILSFGKLFLSISLGYIDECCLGYTFYKKEQGAFKSAADGVVIYAQNIKTLLKSGALTSLIVMGLMLVAMILPFAAFMGIMALFSTQLAVNIIVSLILAAMVASVIRNAFIDSWILVKMMVTYMQVAPTTEITFDLYGKLCKLSSSFRKLFEKGEAEPQPAYAAAGGGAAAAPAAAMPAFDPQPVYSQPAAPAQAAYQQPAQPTYAQPAYTQPTYQQPAAAPQPQMYACGACGAHNPAGTTVCGSCGVTLAPM